MSLENALAENTVALQHLAGVIKGNAAALADIIAGVKAAPAPAPADSKPTPAPKPRAADKNTSAATPASPAPTPPTAEVAADDAQKKTADASDPSAASAETDAQASTAAADTPPPDYPTTAKAITELVKAKGRDAAVAVLAEFGAANLKEVPAEKYAEVIAACKEASA